MFKRNQKTAAQLQEQLKELSGSQKFEKDPAEWSLTTDKAGNGSATIRFLPATGEGTETVPFVKIFSHSFKDPQTGKWYIENCPTTIGHAYDDCPVCRNNGPIYEAGKNGDKAAKDLASARSRKMSYWANIFVVKDDANPEAVGKVFKFRFGKKIFEKIQAALMPEMEEETPINVTDVFEGANFLLKVKQVSGFANYDDSKFASKISELCDGDEAKLEAVWKAMHKLQPIIAPKEFKSVADLEKSFARATGATATRKETPAEREVREARTENPTTVHDTSADDGTDNLFADEPKKETSIAPTTTVDDGMDDIQGFLDSLGG